MPRTLTIAFLLASLVAGAAWSAPATLRVGWDAYPPYQMGGDPPRGIDIELTAAIVAKAGYAAEFIQQPWARQLSSMEAGRLDILMVAAKTAERARFANWTILFRPLRVALIAAKDGAPSLGRLEDLRGKNYSIGAQIGTNYAKQYKTLADGSSIASLFVELADNVALTRMLMSGRLSYVLSEPDEIQYIAFANKLGPTRVALELPSAEGFLMVAKSAIAANPGLMDRLNEAILALRADGTYAAVYARYGIDR